ncbi:DNA-binding transcriptional LysR family regulator [Saccharopolyspora lacisalsi]|uniref:DNA-binding transcriptional LysR family regulator n=1 Tax=Halosaccharopolyspora lacisalsi TaxID=1000566 RepID=A0A839DRF0_9PSEU|nr:LysR substrate-binding domain-containing protein [Halosaccharopolyspora lacisalsi]MBA8824094.1 DNA-binding transcriptional LysR family regulator [Halosaccharopolyspora lacisalsi]
MDLRDVEAFIAVAEELHFGRAAARLHMAQPPLSNRISQLENELQFKLFQRNTRNVALTDGGARLLEPARRLLGQAAAVRDVAASIVSGDEGRVRIGFAGASSQRALPLLTRAVRETHPGIELVLQSQTYVYTAFERLVAGDLDLAFVRTPVARPELRHRVVEVEQVLCALPDGHRLADEPSVRLEDLVDDEFASLPDDRGSKLQQTMYSMCLRAGFQPKIAQVAPDSSTVLALVAAGAGVTITLSSVRPVQSVGIVYKPIEGTGPSHQFAALAWHGDNTSSALRRVLEVGEEALPTPDLYGFDNTD